MSFVFLLGALAIDTGNWFTHKRQLQNRADAGAFAAGVSYEKYWLDCVGPQPATAAANITQAAHQYAGDPAQGTNYNTQVAAQAKVNVNVNQTTYDPLGLDGNDGGGPCFNHPANPNDDTSPQGGYWTDVKVNESDVPLLLGSFGVTPPRITARARIEIRPAVSDNRFLPLAVPDERILQAQVRFINECPGQPPAYVGSPVNLAELPAAQQTAGGMKLWGVVSNGAEVQSNIPIPSAGSCPARNYIPLGVEVRVSGLAGNDITTPTCATLAGAPYTDCWTNLSQVRVWKSPSDKNPFATNVHLSSGTNNGDCVQDPYFSLVASCAYGASVNMNWAGRDAYADLTKSTFTVKISGTTLTSGTPGGPWSGTGLQSAALGAQNVTVDWTWVDKNTAHNDPVSGQACKASGNNPCDESGSFVVHRTYVGSSATTGDVSLIKLTSTPAVTGVGVTMIDSYPAPASATTVPAYITIGLQSSISVGQLTVLRASGSQGNQSLNCNNDNNGNRLLEFSQGCLPYYGANSFSGTDGWWPCPSNNSQLMSMANNSPSTPWRCTVASPGATPNTVAEGTSAYTKNCAMDTSKGGCQPGSGSCVHPNNYAAYTNGTLPVDPADPRIAKIIIVPYGSLRGVNSNDTIPVLDFASFYIAGWNGNGSAAQGKDDPCKNDSREVVPAASGEIDGYFIQNVGPSTGPVDPNQVCTPTQLRPCRVTLVR